jgi:valyl-tRNA synthetase
MPFVTEAIWQALPDETRGGEALMMARWPQPDTAFLDEEAEEHIELVMALTRGIRNRRAEYNVTPGKRIPALVAVGDASGWLDEQRAILCSLAKLDSSQLIIQPTIQPPAQAATIVVGETVCYLPLAALVDLEAEREKLSSELAAIEGRITRSEKLLAGEFAQRAPEHIVQRERDKLADMQTEQNKLRERLEVLE